jgi:hypothetical protein
VHEPYTLITTLPANNITVCSTLAFVMNYCVIVSEGVLGDNQYEMNKSQGSYSMEHNNNILTHIHRRREAEEEEEEGGNV